MKKTLSLLLALLMLLAVLPAAAEETKEPVTITFGGWGDIVLLHEQVEKFEEKYPWINVEIVKPAGKDWYTADLQKLATEGNMPDVFNVEDILRFYANGWLYDMTELFENDPDSASYPAWTLPYCYVDGKLVALYGALYAYGIEVNLSLLDELNIEAPDYDWTIDEWADLLRQTTVPGVSFGCESLVPFYEYLIPQLDPSLNCFGYNSTTHTWEESEAMLTSLNLVKDLAQEGVSMEEASRLKFGNYSESEEKTAARTTWLSETLGATDSLWSRGKYAMRVNGSWAMNWDTSSNTAYSGFDWAFYPFPSAVEGELGRTALLNEYLGISSTCEHPEEAYLLLKYMSYDMDGYEAKVDHMVNNDRDAMIAKYPDIDPQYIPSKIKIWLLGVSDDPRADEIFAKMKVEKFEGLALAFANRNNNAFMLPDRYALDWWNCYGQNEWQILTNMIGNDTDPAEVMKNIVQYCENANQTAKKANGESVAFRMPD
jgi:ABC-type glycerol-3-phosphate transport system substrate-binding protein